MKWPRSVLILCVLIVFGMSLAVPCEDLSETGYGEYETAPYASTVMIADVIPQASDLAQRVPRRPRHRQSTALPLAIAGRNRGSSAPSIAASRVALVLHGTLLC